MNKPVIVAHYHELWLKRGNRPFFLSKLVEALRLALDGIPIERIERPNDRILIRLGEEASADEALGRLARVSGISDYALASIVARDMNAICAAAFEEMREIPFATFAVRAKRSDKSFSVRSTDIERVVGRYLVEYLPARQPGISVNLKSPDVTCRIEITSDAALVYARKIPGAGGLPANTAGKMMCLLSGGFDSAVAAYRMMKRGAHLSFVHFYSTGARPGEMSLHIARQLVEKLTPWQFTAKLYRVPFEPIQREIVRYAPESFRILLYRRMMLRIAEALARREDALALVTGDSLGQVASQTLRNMVAVEAAATLPVFRPLAGMDKLEIMNLARKIGTHDISAEPFHDCCPVFMPRSPELHATPAELELAEANLDVPLLLRQGIAEAVPESFRYAAGRVERIKSAVISDVKQSAAIASQT